MKCCGEVVKNTVLDKEFYFCRGCKKEIDALPLGITSGVALAYLPCPLPTRLSGLAAWLPTEPFEIGLDRLCPELSTGRTAQAQVTQVDRHKGTVTLELRDIEDHKKLEVGQYLDIDLGSL